MSGEHDLRIAYLINQYPQVSHTFVRNEILELERQGHEIHRFSIGGMRAELKDPADLAERERTTYLLGGGLLPLLAALLRAFLAHPLRCLSALGLALRMGVGAVRPLPYHLIYLAEAALLRRWTAALGIRHIHAHFGTNSAEVAMLARTLGGAPYSFTVHGPEEFDKAGPLKLAEKVRRAAFVVAISSFGRSQLFRHVALADWDKVRIVHCGLRDDYLAAEPAPFPAAPRLICLGRLCEQKGQLVLVEAAALLKARGIAFEIGLIGDGEMRGDLERAVAQAGLGDRIRFMGWCASDAIRAALGGSKGLVLPSFAEGLPVAIMEAMALGRPVISTYIAGIPELIRHGQEGFLVPAGDAGALADAMERLLTLDERAFGAMGEAARRRVGERHAAVTEAAKLGELFQAVSAA